MPHVPARARRACLVAAAVALAAPATAAAHIRTPIVAVDLGVRVTTVPPGVRAHISSSDRTLHVSVARGHSLVLLGYVGEPFARVGAGGAASVARASATAEAVAARAAGRSVTWRDARLLRISPGRRPARWSIPVVADGRRAAIAGVVWRPARPAWWPWAALAGGVLLLAGAAGRWRVGAVYGVLGAGSAACALAAQAGLLAGAYATPGTWIATLDEAAFALVGAWVLRGGRTELRPAAGAGLGALGLAVALSQTPVFLRPIVLSALPAPLDRSVLALSAAAGLAATVAGGAFYARRPRSRSRQEG